MTLDDETRRALHTAEVRAVRTHLLLGLEELHRARQRLERVGNQGAADLLSALLRVVEDIHQRLKQEAVH